jgi:hypothetical protein
LQADPSDLIQSQEAAFDYVVCVLDRPLGDLTGWTGSRAYSTDWDGGEFWGHVGYPSDSGGDRPVYHGPGVMDSTVTESAGGRDSFRIMHRNDIIRGQSGGQFFGWWDGEVGPHVIASQSAENWDTTPGPNAAGGGNPLPELVRHALTVEPQRGSIDVRPVALCHNVIGHCDVLSRSRPIRAEAWELPSTRLESWILMWRSPTTDVRPTTC